MSKTKKILAILLAISLIFAFAACTKSNTDTKSDNTAKKELKNVTLYSRDITKMRVLM